MKSIAKAKRVNSQNRSRGAGALLSIFALCLALTACAGEPAEAPEDRDAAEEETGAGKLLLEDFLEDSPEDSSEDDLTGPVEEGDSYRDFTAVLTDGSSFTLSEHEGSVILLNFWATWCGPCVREMPAFPRLLEKYGEDLTLLAVNLGEDGETVGSFLDRSGYTFPVALDQYGDIGSLYPSDGIPYTVLIGRDGRIACIHLGAVGADAMYEYYCGEIDGLLEENSQN